MIRKNARKLKDTSYYIEKTLTKRDINEDSMEYFKTIFNITDWDLLTQALLGNDSHNMFLRSFIKVYDQALPKRKIKVKQKNLSNSWISKDWKKSLKKPHKNSVYMKNF